MKYPAGKTGQKKQTQKTTLGQNKKRNSGQKNDIGVCVFVCVGVLVVCGLVGVLVWWVVGVCWCVAVCVC